MWVAFIAASTCAFAMFFFAKRRFDLLSIAYVGAMFYFSPLFFGRVLQSSMEFSSEIPPAVYLIGCAYMVALIFAAILADRFYRTPQEHAAAPRPLTMWYLVLAVAAFIAAAASSRGAIFNIDKVQALKHVGMLYVLFEVSASLACISAAVERNWRAMAVGVLLLALDLVVGFRVYVVLTALSVVLVLLMREGTLRLYRKVPSYGAAALVLITSMLLVHSARYTVFGLVAKSSVVTKSSEMRGDTIQFNDAADGKPQSTLWKLIGAPLRIFQQSEPFMIQATLVATIERPLVCEPSNILKSIYILIPPGLTRFIPNPYPLTFYDEFKPVLYPNVTYGMGGNIWAEMLCRFGYVGNVVFGVLLLVGLMSLYALILRAPHYLIPPLAFAGVIIGFYVHRNDLNYTLVMIRQVWVVFVIAFFISLVIKRPTGSRLGSQNTLSATCLSGPK